MRNIRSTFFLITIFFLASCASVQIQNEMGLSNEANEENYAKNKEKLGIVLLDARWARQWKCGKYENAQLVNFSFDKAPITEKPDDAPSDIAVGTKSLLSVSPKFESYALLVPPGEYVLSGFKIKTAESISKVGYWVAGRSHLIKNDKPLGGKFNVAAGETVYIGNFALDCYAGPTLWRYYADGQDGFNKQLSDYKAKYPFLDLTNVKFRLFQTETIGRNYELK